MLVALHSSSTLRLAFLADLSNALPLTMIYRLHVLCAQSDLSLELRSAHDAQEMHGSIVTDLTCQQSSLKSDVSYVVNTEIVRNQQDNMTYYTQQSANSCEMQHYNCMHQHQKHKHRRAATENDRTERKRNDMKRNRG